MRSYRNTFSQLAALSVQFREGKAASVASSRRHPTHDIAQQLEAMITRKDCDVLQRLVWKFKTRHSKALHYRKLAEVFQLLQMIKSSNVLSLLQLRGDSDDILRAQCYSLVALPQMTHLFCQATVKAARQMMLLLDLGHYEGYAKVALAVVSVLHACMADVAKTSVSAYADVQAYYWSRKKRQSAPTQHVTSALQECSALVGGQRHPLPLQLDQEEQNGDVEEYLRVREKQVQTSATSSIGAAFFDSVVVADVESQPIARKRTSGKGSKKAKKKRKKKKQRKDT